MQSVTQGSLDAALQQAALVLGFDDIAFCSVTPFDEWKQSASASLLNRMISHDPSALLEGARSIVVAVRLYSAFGPWPDGTAPVANYYVNSVKGFEAAKALAAFLTDKGYRALPNPRLPAKQAALRAGLGVQGMNTQFCHNSLGMLVSLHLVLTDAPLAVTETERAECCKCGVCAAACPGGAIVDGGFDQQKCLRLHMASGSVMPLWARPLMGIRLTGCTDCQHACPDAATRVEEVPQELAWACGIAGLLSGNEAQMEKLAEAIGSNFARPKRIRQQAAICAGNSGNRAYVPQLASLMDEPDAVLRSHAAWALGRLGGEEAEVALHAALAAEPDDEVRLEILNALGVLGGALKGWDFVPP